MKTKLLNLIVALAFGAEIVTAAPLGSTFTYQGKLVATGQPANGSYDLKFTLYDDGSVGNVVGASLTNAATGVTNGLFTVAMDFGSGVFDGDPRWLEIGVRTNGGSVFTTLSPRQALSAVPYAIYAPNAGTATTAASASSVAAANISGTLSYGQLPGTILSNNASAVNLNGTFTGNGAGLTSLNGTNISNYSVVADKLDNPTWAAMQASKIADYGHYNRFGWTNTLDVLKNRQRNFRLILQGTGLTSYTTGYLLYYLTNRFQLAGLLSPYSDTSTFGSYFYVLSFTGSAGQGAHDTNWFGNYTYQIGLNDTSTTTGNFVWNVLELDLLQWPGGGTFKLQTNSTGSTYLDTELTSIDTYSATRTAKTVFWTNPASPRALSVRLVKTSGSTSTNYYLGVNPLNNTITNGLVFGMQAASSSQVKEMLDVDVNVRSNIYKAWNPDMVILINGDDYPGKPYEIPLHSCPA